MVIELHNFKILLSLLHGCHLSKLQNMLFLLWLSHPTISKVYQSSTWNFFVLIILRFLEIGRNCMSIIIKYFGYFMPMNWRILRWVPPMISLPLLCFHQVCLLFYKEYFFSLLLPWSDYLHFQSNTIFFFQLIAGQFWFFCFLYMCFYGFFYNSSIMKLQINNLLFAWLSFWPIIKSCYIRKEFMVWKLQAVAFSVSEETNFEVDTTSIILNSLYHFGNVKIELFRCC